MSKESPTLVYLLAYSLVEFHDKLGVEKFSFNPTDLVMLPDVVRAAWVEITSDPKALTGMALELTRSVLEFCPKNERRHKSDNFTLDKHERAIAIKHVNNLATRVAAVMNALNKQLKQRQEILENDDDSRASVELVNAMLLGRAIRELHKAEEALNQSMTYLSALRDARGSDAARNEKNAKADFTLATESSSFYERRN